MPPGASVVLRVRGPAARRAARVLLNFEPQSPWAPAAHDRRCLSDGPVRRAPTPAVTPAQSTSGVTVRDLAKCVGSGREFRSQSPSSHETKLVTKPAVRHIQARRGWLRPDGHQEEVNRRAEKQRVHRTRRGASSAYLRPPGYTETGDRRHLDGRQEIHKA